MVEIFIFIFAKRKYIPKFETKLINERKISFSAELSIFANRMRSKKKKMRIILESKLGSFVESFPALYV